MHFLKPRLIDIAVLIVRFDCARELTGRCSELAVHYSEQFPDSCALFIVRAKAQQRR